MNDENPEPTTTPEVPPAEPRAATRKPWMIAAATGAAGVVVGGVLGATLSSAGAQDTGQQGGPGTGQMQGGPGQQGGPPGQAGNAV
jgi:hypothetical protein